MVAGRRRRWFVRGLALVCLGLSLAAPRLPSSGPGAPPVAIVDVSLSIGRGPLAPPSDVRIAPGWFATAATVREVEGHAAAPGISRTGSRLSEALKMAASAHPGRDLWLFTDGRGTDGDAAEAARTVAAAGGRVFVSAPPQPAADVALVEARAHPQADGSMRVSATVAASTTGRVHLRLSRAGKEVDETVLDVEPGITRRADLRDLSPGQGAVAYDLRLEPGRGTPNDDPLNDHLELGVQPTRRSVLVWGDLVVPDWSLPERPFHLRQMAAFEAGALDAADCVVLTSLPWQRIGEARVRDLVAFVAGGGRLLILGGPRSWAAGGWAGTPLEEDLSPLRVPRTEGTGLAVVLALDRSGSTADRSGSGAGGAQAHLVRAVREATRDLKPGERLAVLPFSSRPDALPLEPGWLDAGEASVAARKTLETSLSRLVPGGGTDLPAAIEAAARLVAGVEARTRRVVLLTDGDPDHAPDPAALQAVRETLDQLDVGFGALVAGMPEAARRLAVHVARDPADVALLGSSTAFPDRLLHALAGVRAEGEALPRPAGVQSTGPGGSAAFAALEPSRVQAVERAEAGVVIAEALLPDASWCPFAGRRAIGAGEVVALAWGPEWEADSQEAGRTLTGLLTNLANAADRGLAADVDGADLVLALPTAAGAGRLDARAGSEDAPSSSLLEVESGVFRGALPPAATAATGVQVHAGDGWRPLRLPARPSPEHRGAGVDEAALRRIARAGGGRRLQAGAAPPPGRGEPGPHLAPWLLLLGAMLLVIDRALTEGGGRLIRSTSEEARHR